eukprot:1143739-Pelagomonas_calceolata.AAC.6
MPWSKTPCILSTEKRRGKSKRIRRITSRTPCLILLARVKNNIFKSASGANKLLSVLDRISMDRISTKLQSKLGGFVSPDQAFKGAPKKRRHIGSKSRESPSPEGKREASVELVGFWKHAAPGHQTYVEYF